MFFGLPDPDPLVRDTNPDPDPLYHPSIIKQNSKKNLDSYFFRLLLDFLFFKNDVNVPSKSNKQKNCLNRNTCLILFLLLQGPGLNMYNSNNKVVSAVIGAALYPNIVKVCQTSLSYEVRTHRGLAILLKN
jgi:hypothetical protein